MCPRRESTSITWVIGPCRTFLDLLMNWGQMLSREVLRLVEKHNKTVQGIVNNESNMT